MLTNIEYTKKDVDAGQDFYLTFFYWRSHCLIRLGRCAISGKFSELGGTNAEVVSGLPARCFYRIPPEVLQELESPGILKTGDQYGVRSAYGVDDFIKEQNLGIERVKTTPVQGSRFLVEYRDV